MAASFKKTTIKTFPSVGETTTRDSLYWKHLKFPVTTKENGAVTHIEFSPVEPYNYAVTSSVRVQLRSCHSHEVVKNFSRFREVAYSGSFRSDGKLLVAGGDEGIVRLFDVAGKTLLRMFHGHKRPAHVTKFLHDNVRVMSGADDHNLCIWDVPSQAELHRFSDATDYIRCGVASQASKDIVATGCYDHKVRMYDVRTSSSVMTVDHGHPVESVLMYPGGGVILSAGGNVIKVWDALAGGRLLTTLSHHHKTITSLALCSNNSRLVSASLDRHVKFYDVGTYQVVHSLDYPSAILSVNIAPDDSMIVVGMTDGLLSAQKRQTEQEVVSQKLELKKKKTSYRFKLLAKTHVPFEDDHIIKHVKREILAKYDKYLKSFQHSKALDAAMDIHVRMKTPEVTIAVMQELMRRETLRPALAGRDTKSLAAILKFLQKSVSNPRFTSTVIDVSNEVIELYSEELAHNDALYQSVVLLKETIDHEVHYMSEIMNLMGSLDTLFACSDQISQTSASEPSRPIATETENIPDLLNNKDSKMDLDDSGEDMQS